MEELQTPWRSVGRLAAVIAIGASALLVPGWPSQLALGQVVAPDGAGVIAGRVTADRGDVRALRVKARDTARLITYTVYTVKGQYSIYNLPPSTYQVQVMETEFDSPVQRVDVKAGATITADIALTAKPPVAAKARFVSYDELYPPGPARALLEQQCMGCHGANGGETAGFHGMPKRTEEGWAAAVTRMFHVPGQYAQGVVGLAPDAISAQERLLIVKYLAGNFGPGSEGRDLKLEPLVRNEEVLASAVWVQYEGRGTHDLAPTRGPRGRGTIWLTRGPAIYSLDTLNPDPKARLKEYPIADARGAFNVDSKAIVERDGHVYWVEFNGDSIGHLNVTTGEMHRYLAPTVGQGMHAIALDSRGDVWYSGFLGTAGRLDMKTKQITEWFPAREGWEAASVGWTPYGMLVDKKDRVWVSGSARRTLGMWDPVTKKWTRYETPSNIRRLTLDSKGRIWMNEYFANAVAMFDPDTKVMSEYKLGLKWGTPYEGIMDNGDTMWLEDAQYQSLVRFDTETKKSTYFPFPQLHAHAPKMEVDEEGTIWSGISPRSDPAMTAFKPKGNVPLKRGARTGQDE